jgi:hypothetical protein
MLEVVTGVTVPTMMITENSFSRIETDITVLKWMVGFNLAATLGILLLLLRLQSL